MLVSRSFKTIRICLLAIFVVALAPSAWPQKKPAPAASAEQRTARYFESLRGQPLLLHAFLQEMPKGGDLHNHLSGAVYAESFIQWAAQDGLCVDRNALALAQPPCDATAGKPAASVALQDSTLYGHLLDALSMRQFVAGAESGHDHFFATFGKFGAATNGRTADMLAEARSRAAAGHLQYMELMFNPDGGAAARLGASLGWNDDLGKLREQLLSGGLGKIVADSSKFLDDTEKKEQEELRCGQPQPDHGCNVEARYLYQVGRGLPKEMVFAQILAGFEMASKDPRVVGLNLVMPEDAYLSVHDFNLHMRMLDFLHGIYPKVHITLHAGELTQNLVSPEALFHIRASIEQGHAERIGHGVDVMQEPKASDLLKEMAAQGVLVEICLTSNDVILNVTGDHHPLPLYLKYDVPVALATDDPGVSRGDITQEYERAAATYHLKYQDLKKFARASLEYSFLPGESLWKSRKSYEMKSECAGVESMSNSRPACEQLLKNNPKAKAELKLELTLDEFENHFTPPANTPHSGTPGSH
ncbi:MAG TPA: adenosine deaminase [Candidatus Angelobacter sp.]|nr:adenosine deaminase [Candidatus Angelobacter sp.]